MNKVNVSQCSRQGWNCPTHRVFAAASAYSVYPDYTRYALCCPPSPLVLFAVLVGRATRTHRETHNLFQKAIHLAEFTRKIKDFLVGPTNALLVLWSRLATILHLNK
jgi:hypothetical protein